MGKRDGLDLQGMVGCYVVFSLGFLRGGFLFDVCTYFVLYSPVYVHKRESVQSCQLCTILPPSCPIPFPSPSAAVIPVVVCSRRLFFFFFIPSVALMFGKMLSLWADRVGGG